MSLTIEQIESQISELQKTLEALKNPKLEVVRQFTGQYFAPYQGNQFRRMESDGVPIWECFIDNWVKVERQQSEDLEAMYLKDCVGKPEKTK